MIDFQILYRKITGPTLQELQEAEELHRAWVRFNQVYQEARQASEAYRRNRRSA